MSMSMRIAPDGPSSAAERVVHVHARPFRRDSACDGWIVHPPAVRGYVKAVREQLRNGPIRWDERRTLLDRAERLGIDRFQANLLIAQAQFADDGGGPQAEIDADEIRTASCWTHAVACFAAIQSGIVLTLWWLTGL